MWMPSPSESLSKGARSAGFGKATGQVEMNYESDIPFRFASIGEPSDLLRNQRSNARWKRLREINSGSAPTAHPDNYFGETTCQL
jgi:hypothetical protein